MTKEELIKKVIEEVEDEELRNKILSEILSKKEGKITAKDVGYLLEDFGFNMRELGQFTKFQYICAWIIISIIFIFGVLGVIIFSFPDSFDSFGLFFSSGITLMSLGAYYQLWLMRKVPDRLKKIGKSD